MRFDHLYYDVNVFAGNPPITTDALNPTTVVPACTTTNVIYDDTGAGTNIGYHITGQQDPEDNVALGYLVTPTNSGNLAAISAPVGYLSGTSATVTFSVFTNTVVNNVNTPGTLLDTLTATVTVALNPSVVSPVTAFPSTNNPFLSTEQSYWIIASSSASEFGWNASNVLAPPGTVWSTDNGQNDCQGCGANEAAMTLTAVVIQ
jgi:hypothetical protein